MNDNLMTLLYFLLFIHTPFPVFIKQTIVSKLRLMKLAKNMASIIKPEKVKLSFFSRIPKMETVYKGLPVSVEFPRATPNTKRIRIIVQHQMKYNIQIKSKRRVSGIVRRYVRGKLIVGDEYFDKFFLNNGNKADLLLFCSSQTREILLTMMKPSISFAFTEKDFNALVFMKSFAVAEDIKKHFDQIITLCTDYSIRSDIQKTLMKNIIDEKILAVKGTFIEAVYTGVFDNRIDKDKMTEDLLALPDWYVRIRTAGQLQERGFDLLMKYYNENIIIDYKLLVIREIQKYNSENALIFLLDCLKTPHERIIIESLNVIGHKLQQEIVVKNSSQIGNVLNAIKQNKLLAESIVRQSDRILNYLKSLPSSKDQGWLSVSVKDESGALSLECGGEEMT